jgi:hypothetical protein
VKKRLGKKEVKGHVLLGIKGGNKFGLQGGI